MGTVNRWLTAAVGGLLISVTIAETLCALVTLVTAGEHLLWALTRPDAAASADPAWLAVIWLIASAAGAALACGWSGRMSAALPCAILPAGALLLVSWYFDQPGAVGGVAVAGPALGSLLGCAGAAILVRRDRAEPA